MKTMKRKTSRISQVNEGILMNILHFEVMTDKGSIFIYCPLYICTCIEIIVSEQVARRIHISEDWKFQEE
jgi:hypothetical protein